ncbi:MAG TPA: hypothetical protein VF372_01195 [Thermodesulfobacteriota bacterium]
MARKQGRYAEKASAQLFRIADFEFRIFLVFFFNPHSAIGIPQFVGGPIGRYPIRNSECGIRNSFFFFPFRIPHSTFRILVARPVQEMKHASWFLRVTPLLSGRATPEIQSILRHLDEK